VKIRSRKILVGFGEPRGKNLEGYDGRPTVERRKNGKSAQPALGSRRKARVVVRGIPQRKGGLNHCPILQLSNLVRAGGREGGCEERLRNG